MGSNLIGHKIFLTSEKISYDQSEVLYDFFFKSEKIRIAFSRLCEVIESECLQRSLLSQDNSFKVCRH